MVRTNWTKQIPGGPTDWTKQTINPTPWSPIVPPLVPTGALLLSGGGFLELSNGNILGILEE